jgi:hypothetical protein
MEWSGISNRFSAGVCGPRYNLRENMLMGSLSAVFQAESLAILRFTELLLSKNVMRRRIHICSDKHSNIYTQFKNFSLIPSNNKDGIPVLQPGG